MFVRNAEGDKDLFIRNRLVAHGRHLGADPHHDVGVIVRDSVDVVGREHDRLELQLFAEYVQQARIGSG
jgi:hypothetical protein